MSSGNFIFIILSLDNKKIWGYYSSVIVRFLFLTMTLQIDWVQFAVFLYIEKKLKKSNGPSYFSRFKIITSYFRDKDFSRDGINEFFRYLQDERKLENQSLNNYLKLLKHICGFLNVDYLKNYSYFPKVKKTIDPFTVGEIQRIINRPMKRLRNEVETNFRYKCIFTAFATTGMRVSELLDMRYEQDHGSYFEINGTKTVSSTRNAPIVPQMRVLLDKLYRKYGKLKHGYIFGGRKARMDHQTVNRELRERCERLGIKKKEINCKLFRHSFVSIMGRYLGEASLPYIARIVGHSTIQTTYEHYLHYNIQDLSVIASRNPILSKTFTLEQLSSEIIKTASLIVDKSRFRLDFSNAGNIFDMKIIKL